MTRFYFHIRNADQLTPDEEGMDLIGIAEARLEARLSAGDLVRAAMRGGRGLYEGAIEITDDVGNIVDAFAMRSLLN